VGGCGGRREHSSPSLPRLFEGCCTPVCTPSALQERGVVVARVDTHLLACAPKARREAVYRPTWKRGPEGRRGVGGLASTARCWNTITVAHGRSAPAQRDVGCVDFRERNVKCGAGAEVWRLIPCFLREREGWGGFKSLAIKVQGGVLASSSHAVPPYCCEWAGSRRACGQCFFHGHCNTEHAGDTLEGAWLAWCSTTQKARTRGRFPCVCLTLLAPHDAWSATMRLDEWPPRPVGVIVQQTAIALPPQSSGVASSKRCQRSNSQSAPSTTTMLRGSISVVRSGLTSSPAVGRRAG
jgi:hypothetical protein